MKVAGDGSLKSWLLGEIEGVEGIEYLGKLQKSELNALIFRQNGMKISFAVTEALLQGKIVIGSNKGGIPELVKHAETDTYMIHMMLRI